jgi:hypothetical protein
VSPSSPPRRARAPILAALVLVSALPGCRKKDRLDPAPYPRAKLAYRSGNCIYMDLNHAGEPDKGICYGDRGEPMLAADFDGNGTTDLAVRRGPLLLIDTAGDGQGHEAILQLGDLANAVGFIVGDFSGTADRHGRASVCAVHPGPQGVAGPLWCRVAGMPAGAGDHALFAGQEAFAGRWRKDGPARLGTRTGLCVDLDENGDDRPDKHLCYEDLGSIDQVLAGDWNGDGRDDLVLRRGSCVFVDIRLDGTHPESQCLGEGRGAVEYFVGSWDGK